MIEWELAAILITLICGFAGIFFRLGKRDENITTLQRDVKWVTDKQEALETSLDDHEKHCADRERTNDSRFADGSKKMELLAQGQDHIKESVNDMKESIKDTKDTVNEIKDILSKK